MKELYFPTGNEYVSIPTLREETAAIESFSDERLRESHLNLTRALVVRFSFAQAIDEDYMRRLLTCAGIPLREAS